MLRTAWATFARAITRTGVAAGATIIAFCSVVRATLTTAVGRTAFLDLGVIDQVLAGLGQQAVERGGINPFEGAEIGHGQGGALKVAQHLNALTASLTFFCLFGFFDGAAALEFILRGLAMLVGDVACGVAIQVKTLGGFGQTNQVAIAAGVATQEGRQHRLGEHAWGTFLDISLDTQFQRQGLFSAKQGGKQGLEACAALGRVHGLLLRSFLGDLGIVGVRHASGEKPENRECARSL